MSEYLSTEEVCGRLHRAGIDTATVSKVFAARLQPEAAGDPTYEHDFDKKYVLGVPAPGNQAYLVLYKFGLGNPHQVDPSVRIPQETGPDWRPRWISVEGPFPIDQAADKARELTNA